MHQSCSDSSFGNIKNLGDFTRIALFNFTEHEGNTMFNRQLVETEREYFGHLLSSDAPFGTVFA